MRSWYTIRALATGAELSIYDEIGAYGVSAKQFIAELGSLSPEAPVELRLNSPGGSVFDAVAIYNALKRHAGTVTVVIDGIAASAASYIAMAGDEVVMPENAFLMIHDPSGMVLGTAADMRAMAEALDKIAGSLVRGYAAKSGKSDEEIAALMAAETWLTAAEAVELGLADRLSEPVRIAASFDVARFRNAPPDLVKAVEQAGEPPQEKTEPDPIAGSKAVPEGDPPTPDSAAVRGEVMAYARAVLDLCRLAGQPQMAAGFLAEETGLDEVRKALIDAHARAEPEISAAHPQPGPVSQAGPWGEVIARTFKRKG